MNILLVAPVWGYEGGIERYVVDCIVEFTRIGHRCSLVYGTKSPKPVEQDIARLLHVVHQISSLRHFESTEDTVDVERLGAILQEERPDVVFMSEVKNFALLSRLNDYGSLVPMSHGNTLVCMRTSNTTYLRRTVCTHNVGYRCFLHGCFVRKKPYGASGLSYNSVRKQEMLLDIYKNIGIHVVPSNYSKQRLVQHGFRQEEVAVVGYFTDIKALPPVPLTGDCPTVLFVGRIDRYKGVDYLLRALKKVTTPLKCTVIGDGDYLPHCKQLAHKLQISHKVNFEGWLSRPEIATHLRAASVSIVPSIWSEAFGIVGLEAMMCSKPVVAFNAGGISDWLKDGKTGYLVPIKNSALMADKIEALLRDPVTAANMGAEGLRFVTSTFSKEQHFERLFSVFSHAVANKGRSRHAFRIMN